MTFRYNADAEANRSPLRLFAPESIVSSKDD